MFRKLSVPLAMLMAAATLGAAMPAMTAGAVIAPETYLIRNVKTGKYLTSATDRNTNNGGILCIYDADGRGLYNTWIRETTDDGQVQFCSSASQSLVFTVTADGRLTLGENTGVNPYQQFETKSVGEGTDDQVYLEAGGWCLTPDGETNGSGVSMQEQGDASVWQLIPIQYNMTMPGDMNKDGEVDVFDLDLSMRYLVADDMSDIEHRAIGDVNRDGDFDIIDIIKVVKYLHGEEPLFRKGESQHLYFPHDTYDIPDSDVPAPDTPDPETPDTPDTPDPETPETPDTPDPETPETPDTPETPAASKLTLADMPAEYKDAMEWIWQNRFVREGSTTRRNTIFDQIVAGKGTLNFVVRWQSYKPVTYEQRQQFEKMASDCVNAWNDYLKGYDGWEYDHIDVKIVGWAVLDRSCLLELHEDEVVYDNLITDYDASGDTSNGREEIPNKLPSAPTELSRFDHFDDPGYEYPGGLDKRFDMYFWCTQGFPDIGGCGGDWGQRLSDNAYLAMLDGTNLHVLEHEIGHGFGITDFYGGEGEPDGFPSGGFPGGGTSIMMAGSSAVITDFDGWMLRYIWSNIKDEEGRF